MSHKLAGIARMKHFFLKGVAAVYLIAFTSLYLQVHSLFGDNGVVPVRDFMSKLDQQQQNTKRPMELQSIIALAPKIGLRYGEFIELLCIIGALVSLGALATRRLSNALSFGLLWYIYYSISLVGQGFMAFHSDLLLLEVGFITILLAPLLPTSRMSQSDHDHICFFLVRWLTFRYFVTNAIGVYLDNDDAWYKMTAIPMVAQGVQFPSLFSWNIFNFPLQYVQLYQAYEHSVMLCAPFLMLFDLKYARFTAFYTLALVAIPSALFFNFGWTQILITICLVSYLKDAYFYSDQRAKQSGLRTFFDILMNIAYIGTVVFLITKCYGIRLENGVLKSQVKFTPTQFKAFADHLVPASLVFGLLGLLSAAHTTFFSHPRKTSIIKSIVYTLIALPLFLSTFPNLTRFAPGLENKIKPVALTKDLSRFVAPYMLSNNYILLSRVSQHYGDGRSELQVQGRASADSPSWEQYDLLYKPGMPSRELARVVPHLPRIDLKMWYAARSSLQNNQWLQTFAYRVAMNEKDVVSSLSKDTNVSKISQVRIVAQTYKYSTKGKVPFAGYWSQSKTKSEYMPATALENLKFSVKSNGISLTSPPKPTTDSKSDSLDKLFRTYLEISSDFIRGIDHMTLIWSLGFIATISIFN